MSEAATERDAAASRLPATAPTVTAPVGGAFLVEDQRPDEVLVPEAIGEDMRMIAAAAREFVAREVEPVAARLEALDYELSRELMQRAGAQGLLAVEVPEEHGGLGAGKVAASVVTEALAASGSFNVTFNAHVGIGTLPLVYFGSAEQKARYLPRLATGEWVAAYCLTEPGSGSDSLAAKTRADDAGDHWVLNGTKMWISNAGFADLFTVFAQVDGERFSAFLVTRDTPGLSLGAEERKMGIKGSSTRMVVLEDARVPKENLLGAVGKGHHIAFGILNIGRFKLAVGAVGGVKRLIGLAQAYAQERRQFGAPIATFGLIKEKVGGMSAHAYALESAVYRLAGALDAAVDLARAQAAGAEELARVEMAALSDYAVEFSFIKVFGSEVLDAVVDEALQVYGGYGFSADYPIEAAYRDSRINRIFEGTNDILRLFIALSAMDDVGQNLKEIAQSVRGVFNDPIKGFGVLSDYALRRATLATGIRREHFQFTKLPEVLKAEQEVFESATRELAEATDRILRKHGKGIIGKQFASARLAEVMIHLFVFASVLSRVTSSIQKHGVNGAQREIQICRAFGFRVRRHMQIFLHEMEENADEDVKGLADHAFELERYQWDTI